MRGHMIACLRISLDGTAFQSHTSLRVGSLVPRISPPVDAQIASISQVQWPVLAHILQHAGGTGGITIHPLR